MQNGDRTEITIERIKKLCEDHGYSLSGLEKKLGYGNTSLSKAKNISSGRVAEIADFFDVSADYIIGRSDVAYNHRKPKTPIIINDLVSAICTKMGQDHPEWFDDEEDGRENNIADTSNILSHYNMDEVTKALDLFHQYEQASPEVQSAVELLLKAAQSES